MKIKTEDIKTINISNNEGTIEYTNGDILKLSLRVSRFAVVLQVALNNVLIHDNHIKNSDIDMWCELELLDNHLHSESHQQTRKRWSEYITMD